MPSKALRQTLAAKSPLDAPSTSAAAASQLEHEAVSSSFTHACKTRRTAAVSSSLAAHLGRALGAGSLAETIARTAGTFWAVVLAHLSGALGAFSLAETMARTFETFLTVVLARMPVLKLLLHKLHELLHKLQTLPLLLLLRLLLLRLLLLQWLQCLRVGGLWLQTLPIRFVL